MSRAIESTRLDSLLVVGVFHALALPKMALVWVVVVLIGNNLLQALDVAIDAALHVVVGLHTTCILECSPWLTTFRLGEITVGIGKRCHAGEGGHAGQKSAVEMHVGSCVWS